MGNMESGEKQKELKLALKQFIKVVYVDFGIEKLSGKLQNWYRLSWEDFYKELKKQNINFNECLVKDWHDFFHNHQSKVISLME
jgi:Trm5-related predicted tRNA methylase